MLFLILILNSYNLIGNRWYYSLIENYTAELISTYFLNSTRYRATSYCCNFFFSLNLIKITNFFWNDWKIESIQVFPHSDNYFPSFIAK